jgi:metacaspase-1
LTKKAFLVGINDYAPAGVGGSDLNGCVNDVNDMANTLVICGFSAKKILICTNRRATKEGIIKGLGWLMRGAKKNDSLVFYYSGHGSQVPNIKLTDGGDIEVDELDEVLCPHDFNVAPRSWVSDDDLRKIFSKIPSGVNLEVITDCCHSGTITRSGLDMDIAAGEDIIKEKVSRIRFLPPPLDEGFYGIFIPDLPKKKILKPSISKRDVVISSGITHSLWAACLDNQESEETRIENKIRGVFTYYFCQVLRKTEGNITRRRLQSIVNAAIKRGRFVQTLQLEASSENVKEKPFW